MIISWNWLKEYVRLDMSLQELEHRLMMSGLNHEGTVERAGDFAIDLEVTSNRPDCLCHIGVARETAVLFDHSLSIPTADPQEASTPITDLSELDVQCPDLCPRYVARVIQGVTIKPSPDWLQRRLDSLGVAIVNNVVDITNYVLLECGQPLHAFDYQKLDENRIVVRQACSGEKLIAINQRSYDLDPGMCVIADADKPVAIAGIMGGLQTEVSEETTDLLIESAIFDPLSVRTTSRALSLNSDSSYRFERGIDVESVDWASRRACDLILNLAGGTLASGKLEFATSVPSASPVRLRFDQLKRILGITVDGRTATEILNKLGLKVEDRTSNHVTVIAPSWRKDLTREIDLVEEVGRIHGYESVPETETIAVHSFNRSMLEQLSSRIRDLLCGAGFDDALTYSMLDEDSVASFSPWSSATPLSVEHPSRRRECMLRKSLIPSLLAARHHNQSQGNNNAELIELAHVYLPGPDGSFSEEPTMIGIVSNRTFEELKGLCEWIVQSVNPDAALQTKLYDNTLSPSMFQPSMGAELILENKTWGYLGPLSDPLIDHYKLHAPCSVVELRMDLLEHIARAIPQYCPLSTFPSLDRELSLIVDESTSWQELEQLVKDHAGNFLETIEFLDHFRGDPIPRGKKSLHFRTLYRAAERTLTNEEVDHFQQAIILACQKTLSAILRL